jgi:hypothetical protein
MKKVFAFLALCLLVLAPVAFADMDNEPFSATVIGLATNSRTIVVRGALEAVHYDITAGSTSDVRVTSTQGTLFEKTGVIADGFWLVAAPVSSTNGTLLGAFQGAGSNTLVRALPMAGPITVRVIGGAEIQTNSYTTTLLYSR